jgi:capsular exopolysaccharide synthesis family protein
VLLRRRYRRSVTRQIRAARPDIERRRRINDPIVQGEVLEQLARLRALRRLGEPVEIARRAKVPSRKLAPRPVRNTLLGLLAGLTLGLVAAFARDALDRRVRASGDIADSSSLPILGHTRAQALGKLSPPGSGKRKSEVDLEAVRIVRANLEFLDLERPPACILVTSALPEEGKSTVAASLAMANALAGKTTLLLECDLRKPVLASRLGLEQAPGLSDHLTGGSNYDQITQTVALGGTPSNGAGPNGQEPTREALLSVITSGSPAPRSAELLGSQRFADFIRAATEAYDTVVIDSSPVLPVADTLEIVEHADRVVICARSRRTTRDQLKAAVDVLGRVPGPVAGIVVTGVRKGDELDYGYYSAGGATASVSRA